MRLPREAWEAAAEAVRSAGATIPDAGHLPPLRGTGRGGGLRAGGEVEAPWSTERPVAAHSALTRHAAAAFLTTTGTVVAGRGCSKRAALASSFLAPKTPVLGDVKIMLMYQTPQIYKTDIAEKALGGLPRRPKYACKQPQSMGLGEKDDLLHPSIIFNGKVGKIHVRMRDNDTGEIFWDADYKLPFSMLWAALGKSELPSKLKPIGEGFFRKPCVARDDHTTHHFTVSIQTQDGYYEDNATPWGEDEGFQNLLGPQAYIGFNVKRYPKLEKGTADPSDPQLEVLGIWRRGGSVSRSGEVRHDRYDRVRAGEENPFEDPVTGDDGKLYYDYIIKPEAKMRKAYEIYDKYGAPPIWPAWGEAPKMKPPPGEAF